MADARGPHRLTAYKPDWRALANGSASLSGIVVDAALAPLPVEWVHALVDAIAGADLVLLESAGHFPHVEDGDQLATDQLATDQLATAVLPWLAEHAV